MEVNLVDELSADVVTDGEHGGRLDGEIDRRKLIKICIRFVHAICLLITASVHAIPSRNLSSPLKCTVPFFDPRTYFLKVNSYLTGFDSIHLEHSLAHELPITQGSYPLLDGAPAHFQADLWNERALPHEPGEVREILSECLLVR